MILLQTVPFSIDIENFQKEILQRFPQISSIHELHLWELTHSKLVCTAHMIFDTPEIFKESINEIINYFHEQDINIVTIQPEFKTFACQSTMELQTTLVDEHGHDTCLVACRQITCDEKLCCQRKTSSDTSLDSHSHDHHDCKSKQSASSHVLEQVISVRNVSTDEISAVSNSIISTDSIDNPTKKISLTSLPNPPKYKLHKTVSVSERENSGNVVASSEPGDIHLVSFKRVVSESMIKSDEHDELGRKASEIFVENRLYHQTNVTDKDFDKETEDIHAKFET